MATQTTITELSPIDTIEGRIEAFSKLPYKNSPYKSRNWGHGWHSLCSYPSKLKPAIAHHLIKHFSEPDGVILDPFSGVGTIPFEACLNGRIGMGIDLNPLAFHTTNAKLSHPEKAEVMEDFTHLAEIVKDDERSTDPVPEEIKEFFHPQTLKEIVNARYFLLKEYQKEPRSSISFLISNIAHILHGNRPYALSRRSHNVIPIPPKGDFKYKSLIEHTRTRLQKYLKILFPSEFKIGKCEQDSVFNFVMDKGTVDVIITSPPFFGNTDFLRQNRVRIWFCGWDYQEQSNVKSEFVDHMDLSVYANIFDRFDDVLRENGLCIFHLGVVKKKDMALSILPYGEKRGFTKIGLIYEDTTNLESHGRTDRGGTHKHQFLILKK